MGDDGASNARGVAITYVAQQLGHARPTTTLQWYAHWLPSEGANYVDALDTATAPDHPAELFAD